MPFRFSSLAAEALLVANERAMRTRTSFRAEGTLVTTSLGSDGKPQFERYASLTVVMARPGLLREETWPTTPEGRKTDSVPNSLSVSNGKTLLIQSGREYHKLPVTPINLSESGTDYGFFSGKTSLQAEFAKAKARKTLRELTLASAEQIDGEPCDVVRYHYSYGTDMPLHCSGKLYFGADHLLRRRVTTISRLASRPAMSGGIVTTTLTFHKIETNFPTPAPVTFAYTPPAEVKPSVASKPDAEGWIQVSPSIHMRNRGSYWEVVHDAQIINPTKKKKRDPRAH